MLSPAKPLVLSSESGLVVRVVVVGELPVIAALRQDAFGNPESPHPDVIGAGQLHQECVLLVPSMSEDDETVDLKADAASAHYLSTAVILRCLGQGVQLGIH
jgi:hypothetical protein